MGKRKSSAKPQKKIKQKLDTTFTCLFCNHEASISCTIDKKVNIGTLNCKICGQNFQCPINSLSEPVDIYSNWIDACEAVAEDAGDENDYEEDADVDADVDSREPSKSTKIEDDDEDDDYD